MSAAMRALRTQGSLEIEAERRDAHGISISASSSRTREPHNNRKKPGAAASSSSSNRLSALTLLQSLRKSITRSKKKRFTDIPEAAPVIAWKSVNFCLCGQTSRGHDLLNRFLRQVEVAMEACDQQQPYQSVMVPETVLSPSDAETAETVASSTEMNHELDALVFSASKQTNNNRTSGGGVVLVSCTPHVCKSWKDDADPYAAVSLFLAVRGADLTNFVLWSRTVLLRAAASSVFVLMDPEREAECRKIFPEGANFVILGQPEDKNSQLVVYDTLQAALLAVLREERGGPSSPKAGAGSTGARWFPKCVLPKDMIRTWKIAPGDDVRVLSGKDKKKEGVVLAVDKRRNMVKVKGCNLQMLKDPKSGQKVQVLSFCIEFLEPVKVERKIHYSNVNLLDPVTRTPTRTSLNFQADGGILRIAKNSGQVVPWPERKVKTFDTERQKTYAKDTEPGDALERTYDYKADVAAMRLARQSMTKIACLRARLCAHRRAATTRLQTQSATTVLALHLCGYWLPAAGLLLVLFYLPVNDVTTSCFARYWEPFACGVNGSACDFDVPEYRTLYCAKRCGRQLKEVLGSVWGGGDDNVYAASSFLCPAAVHAGLVEDSTGGCMQYKVVAGRTSYPTLPAAKGEGSSTGLGYNVPPGAVVDHESEDGRHQLPCFCVLVWLVGLFHATFFQQQDVEHAACARVCFVVAFLVLCGFFPELDALVPIDSFDTNLAESVERESTSTDSTQGKAVSFFWLMIGFFVLLGGLVARANLLGFRNALKGNMNYKIAVQQLRRIFAFYACAVFHVLIVWVGLSDIFSPHLHHAAIGLLMLPVSGFATAQMIPSTSHSHKFVGGATSDIPSSIWLGVGQGLFIDGVLRWGLDPNAGLKDLQYRPEAPDRLLWMLQPVGAAGANGGGNPTLDGNQQSPPTSQDGAVAPAVAPTDEAEDDFWNSNATNGSNATLVSPPAAVLSLVVGNGSLANVTAANNNTAFPHQLNVNAPPPPFPGTTSPAAGRMVLVIFLKPAPRRFDAVLVYVNGLWRGTVPANAEAESHILVQGGFTPNTPCLVAVSYLQMVHGRQKGVLYTMPSHSLLFTVPEVEAIQQQADAAL
eukprot:g17314.t1